MLIALLLVAVLAIAVQGYVALDRNTKQLKELKSRNFELEQKLNDVRDIAVSHRDLHPLFSDVVVGELNKQVRKEIER